MTYSEAKELQRQVEKKRECNRLLEKLYQQQKELAPKVSELEKRSRKEQSDVNKLEGMSLSSFFYGLTGKKEEKLNKERQEAREAKLKYESATRELAYVEDEIRKLQEELSQIKDCEQEFRTYLEDGYEFLSVAKNAELHKITCIEQKSAELENKLLMVQEAIALGKKLEWDIENMLLILEVAEQTNAEIRAGKAGSTAKLYEQIDMAQTAVVKLQDKLLSFRKKLEQLSVDTEIEVDVDAFMHVLDVPMSTMFYDSRAMFFSILDRITELLKNFQPIKGQAQELMQKLYVLEADIGKGITDANKELEDKIIELVSL